MLTESHCNVYREVTEGLARNVMFELRLEGKMSRHSNISGIPGRKMTCEVVLWNITLTT